MSAEDEKKICRALGKRLAETGIQRLLVEGGSETAGAFLDAGLVDEICFFIAPKLLGGGISVITGTERPLANAFSLRDVRIDRIGDDLLYRARLEHL